MSDSVVDQTASSGVTDDELKKLLQDKVHATYVEISDMSGQFEHATRARDSNSYPRRMRTDVRGDNCLASVRKEDDACKTSLGQ